MFLPVHSQIDMWHEDNASLILGVLFNKSNICNQNGTRRLEGQIHGNEEFARDDVLPVEPVVPLIS